MHEMITLGITETVPGTGRFAVIVLVLPVYQLISFDLEKEDVISSSGEIYWDIGFSTHLESTQSIQFNGNTQYRPNGRIELGQNKSYIIKKALDAKSKSCRRFFENEKETFAVVKVKQVNDISLRIDNKKPQSVIMKFYINAFLNDINVLNSKQTLLNKDYRWVNYWTWIYSKGEFEEKKEKYLKLLNRKDKALYLILYRHRFPNAPPQYWISGMHWL